MKTFKFLMITLAAALVLGGFTHTYAADRARRAGVFEGRFLERAQKKLELTDDQVAQIKAVMKSDKDTLSGLLTQMHEARTGLRTAIRSSDATEASVRTASARVASVQADFAVERMHLFARIYPILTTQQRTKLADLEERMDELADTAIERASERLAE